MHEYVSSLLICMVLMHLLYDFHWQGDFVGTMKSKSDFILFIHCLTYALCIYLVLWIFGMESILKFTLLLVSHWYIDLWKCRKEDKTNSLTNDLYIDQLLHLVVIVICLFNF